MEGGEEQSQSAKLLTCVSWSGASGRCHLADFVRCALGNDLCSCTHPPSNLLSTCCINIACPEYATIISWQRSGSDFWYFCVSLCHVVSFERANRWYGHWPAWSKIMQPAKYHSPSPTPPPLSWVTQNFWKAPAAVEVYTTILTKGQNAIVQVWQV